LCVSRASSEDLTSEITNTFSHFCRTP